LQTFGLVLPQYAFPKLSIYSCRSA
jgi:hypothetical protein